MKVTLSNRSSGSIKIQKTDWILIVGMCLAPMTGLRIWKVGPGEILCLFWGMKNILTFFTSRSDISKFFVFFILSLVAGSFWGYMIAPNELRISDLITWLYLGVITILVYEGLKKTICYIMKKCFFYLPK